MAPPVSPLGTSNIGVDAAGHVWRNTPAGLVEIGGGGLNPNDLVITAQPAALGPIYVAHAMLSLGAGSWHVFGRITAAMIQDGTMIGLNTAPGDTFVQALVSATNTTGGNVTDLTAGPITLNGPITLYLNGEGVGMIVTALIVAQRL